LDVAAFHRTPCRQRRCSPRMNLLLAEMTPSGELNSEKQGRRTPRTESAGDVPTSSNKPGGGVQSTGHGVHRRGRGLREGCASSEALHKGYARVCARARVAEAMGRRPERRARAGGRRRDDQRRRTKLCL
jgi:hypothetical protein